MDILFTIKVSKNDLNKLLKNQTKSIALMQPSSSGLLVTCAYLDHTTLPVWVTKPKSETFTSRTEPI